MKKLLVLLASLMVSIYSVFVSNLGVCMVEVPYFNSFMETQPFSTYAFLQDKSSLAFFFMVALVVMLVCAFSESYMEGYNNKKFFIIMVMFSISMIFMVHSFNFLTFFIGWEGLGVSSLCLIMFYPNKTTLYNSFLTMLYNRLGDSVFVCLFCYMLLNFHSMMCLLSDSKFSSFFFFFILICGFTKSAQFPLSSWLPAAMSAPTPISAMVHSSTLVTAGFYLIHKLSWYFAVTGTSLILTCASLLTFLMGGLMANFEKDFKKIVAFSTMSQISMIMVFCAMHLVYIALTHALFHAFFKTLIFCASGLLFIGLFSEQQKSQLFLPIGSYLTRLFLFISLFSMSGLMFSSSYYTKDHFLELSEYNLVESYMFVLLLTGGLLTLYYSSSLMQGVTPTQSYHCSFVHKAFFGYLWVIFSLIMLFNSLIFTEIQTMMAPVMFSVYEIFFILVVFLIPFFSCVSWRVESLYFYTMDIAFMKKTTFSLLGTLMFSDSLSSMAYSENIFIKSYYLKGVYLEFFFRFYTSYYFLVLVCASLLFVF